MPQRDLVTKALADLLGVLSHPCRIRIVGELRDGEQDVTFLRGQLGISHSGVSQHLAVLRAHRLVAERREGRHVFYHLCQPRLASWLLQGLDLLEPEEAAVTSVREAIEKVRDLWSSRDGEPG